jgi:hypothetical protein
LESMCFGNLYEQYRRNRPVTCAFRPSQQPRTCALDNTSHRCTQ